MFALEGTHDDWKRIYQVLHAQLTAHPELLDSEVLTRLQSKLQMAARLEGVDPTDHAAWDRWLNETGSGGGDEYLAFN